MGRCKSGHFVVVLLAYFLASASIVIAIFTPEDAHAQHGVTHRAPAAPSPSLMPAVIPVTVIPVERAAAILRGLYPRASIRVDQSSNSVIVLASADTVQAMRIIIQGIDVRNPTQPVIEVEQLQHLKSSSVIPRLRELYPSAHIESASKSSILVRATPVLLGQIKAIISSLDTVMATPPPLVRPADALRISYVNPRDVARAISHQFPHLRAGVAGSSVILVGATDDVEKAKALAAQIDQPAFGSKYTQVYRLHNVDATSVGDLIRRSYPNAHVTVDKDLNALSVFATAAEHLKIADGINQLDATGTPAQGGAAGSGGPAYGDSNIDVVDLDSAMPGQNGSNSATATEIATAITQLLGQMAPDLRIVPTNYSQIMLAGSPQSIRLAKDLIHRLDQSQPLVVLDTEVLEVDENHARNLGLQLPQAVISTTFGEISPTPDPNNFGTPSRLIRLQPLTRSPLQFTAELNLLIQNGNARVLADPRITTLSGHTASIRAGDAISILTQTGGGIGTPVIQQVQTFNTGVTLDITPMVGPSGKVTVALHPVVNSLEGILNGVPQIATRDTQTVVQLQDNETLVIGGLIQETMQRQNSQIPILGQIPLVGKLFQSSDVENRRNELIIVVTPHILKPGSLNAPPAAVLPLVTPQPLPTLGPDAVLPTQPMLRASPVPVTLTPPPAFGPTLRTPIPSPTPAPFQTPSAFASANVYSYGSPPQSTFASESDPPQIFYASFSPTILRNNARVTVSAITTTNVRTVTIGYPGYTMGLTQVAPSKWQADYAFNASGLSTGQQTIQLTLSAGRNDGVTTKIQIPINLLP